MKTFIIVALITVSLLVFGGMAFAKYRGGCSSPDGRMGWMAGRISSQLSLDAPQQERLSDLLNRFSGLRQDLRLTREQGRDEISRLISAPRLDRDQARSMLEQRQELLSQKGPEIIEAVAEFTDSLNPEQREQLVAWMNSRRHGRFGYK